MQTLDYTGCSYSSFYSFVKHTIFTQKFICENHAQNIRICKLACISWTPRTQHVLARKALEKDSQGTPGCKWLGSKQPKLPKVALSRYYFPISLLELLFLCLSAFYNARKVERPACAWACPTRSNLGVSHVWIYTFDVQGMFDNLYFSRAVGQDRVTFEGLTAFLDPGKLSISATMGLW